MLSAIGGEQLVSVFNIQPNIQFYVIARDNVLCHKIYGDNDDDVNANDDRDAKSSWNSTGAKISTKSDVIRLTKHFCRYTLLID